MQHSALPLLLLLSLCPLLLRVACLHRLPVVVQEEVLLLCTAHCGIQLLPTPDKTLLVVLVVLLAIVLSMLDTASVSLICHRMLRLIFPLCQCRVMGMFEALIPTTMASMLGHLAWAHFIGLTVHSKVTRSLHCDDVLAFQNAPCAA